MTQSLAIQCPNRGPWACLPERVAEIRSMIERCAGEQSRAGATLAGYAGFHRVGGVAVVSLVGPMEKYRTWASWLLGSVIATEVQAAIEGAVQQKGIGAIALFIDSPGGTVAGTADLAETVRRAAQVKPVTAYISDLGASGAYWVASQCSHISTNSTALVGSIGTYAIVGDFEGLYERSGVKVHVVRTGEFKGSGVEGTEITKEQLVEFQRVIESVNREFLKGVGRGRGLPMDWVRKLADGRVHVASEALGLKLIDAIKPWDDVLAELVARYPGPPSALSVKERNAPASRVQLQALPSVSSAKLEEGRVASRVASTERYRSDYRRSQPAISGWN